LRGTRSRTFDLPICTQADFTTGVHLPFTAKAQIRSSGARSKLLHQLHCVNFERNGPLPMFPRLHQPHRIDASLSVLLAVQIVTLFLAIPLGAQFPVAHLLLDACHLTYALVSVLVLTRHRAVQGTLLASLIILALGPIIGGHPLVYLGLDEGEQHEMIALTAFTFNAAVTVLVARHVFAPGRVTAHRVQGAILLYLNVAALFAIAYSVMEAHAPGAIAPTTGGLLPAVPGGRTAALTYFSLTTITTTGYGDLAPFHPLARSLTNFEAVFGQLFPATLLARIVALHLAHSVEIDNPSEQRR
jgi:hypothetical protein